MAAGEVEAVEALRVIRDAHQRAEKVRALLREVGDTDEQLALSLRFKRTRKRFESSLPDDTAAEIFSRLTLAVHDLNLLLQDQFYSG